MVEEGDFTKSRESLSYIGPLDNFLIVWPFSIAGVVCTAPKIVEEEISQLSYHHVTCGMCMSLANKAFDILIGKGFTKIFRIVCQNFSKYTFGTQNEYLCDVVTEAVENGIKFLEKYIPVMTCRWAALCTVMESLKYVSSPRSLNTNLTCKQCGAGRVESLASNPFLKIYISYAA